MRKFGHDGLHLRSMTAESEEEVLAANRAFYSAFASRQIDAMGTLWATELPVACIHPGWDCLHGREAVLSSFEAILSFPHSPKIRPTDESIVMLGDSAFVTCIERIGDAELLATNIFYREQGQWKIVHHHASPLGRRGATEPPARDRLN